MAIVVIAIHVHPFEGYSRTILLDMYDLLCGCAVPFFFMCTGYFMAQKILYVNYEQHCLKKICGKIIVFIFVLDSGISTLDGFWVLQQYCSLVERCYLFYPWFGGYGGAL